MTRKMHRDNDLASTLPCRAGESHVRLDKVLLAKEKWILKVSLDSEGDANGAIFAVFFQAARSAGE
jgi:hypothetical protein